jgi:hypothetical protein
MGRPTKLTLEAQQRIVQAIKVGATYELAAQYGGVSYNTFNEWMKKGDAAKSGKYREFHEAIKAAEGDAAIKWLAMIDKAAVETWQAAAWKLERRYPQNYGRTVVDQNVRGGGKDGAIEGKITIEYVNRLNDADGDD